MKVNAAWHAKNKMPANPTLDQRIEWHLKHAQYCSCREMPEKIRAELKKRNK